MLSKKIEFTKEKVALPDGRYLIYYNFDPVSEGDNIVKIKPNQINASKGEDHV